MKGVNIYKTDLDYNYENMVKQYTMYFGENEDMLSYLAQQKTYLLDGIIGKQVLLQKAPELGIECSDEEVEAMYGELVEAYTEDYVLEVIEGNGFTVDTYKELLREDSILAQVQEIMYEGDVEVTDEQIEDYYMTNNANYTTGAGGDMEHILVYVTETSDDETKAKADEAVATIESEIASGMTFEELKEKYTADGVDTDLYIVENLGFRQYEEPNFDPLFLAGAKEVAEGEISPAVKSSFGYHFIQVKNIKGEEVTALEEVKEPIMTTLEDQAREALYEEKLATWTSEATVERFDENIK